MLRVRRPALGPFGTDSASSPVHLPPRLHRKEVNIGLLAETASGAEVKSVQRPPARTIDEKPAASAAIEPIGPRVHGSRRHAVRLVLRFNDRDPKFADRRWVAGTAESALAALSDSADHERPSFGEVLSKGRNVLGLEAVAVCPAKPVAVSIDRLRHVLSVAGYTVEAHEARECSEADCTTTVLVDCTRALDVPSGWFAAEVCGRHGYKRCVACGSTYAMSCSNAIGAAPSVHCEVCGGVLVEWGGTKLWLADLVRRADWPRT